MEGPLERRNPPPATSSTRTCRGAAAAPSRNDDGGGEPSETASSTPTAAVAANAVAKEGQRSPTTNGDASARRAEKLPSPKYRRHEWKVLLNDFQNHVLHPCYLQMPLRANTVHSAQEYAMTEPTRHLMPGTHKHLGGAYDPTDGGIYGVPAHSAALLCLRWQKEESERVGSGARGGSYRVTCVPLPERVAGQRFKWLRGIFARGYLWAIPSWADSVLCVDVDALWKRRESVNNDQDGGNIVSLLPLPPQHQLSTWQWHGAGINPEKTAIYCIPSNARHVLKVDLVHRTTSLIDIQHDPNRYPNFSVEHTNKWYGGIPGTADACVYGIPYRSCAVLQIDTRTDTARLIGPDYGVGNYYWHGGINVGGTIYAHPSHARTVLAVRTNSLDPDQAVVEELPITFGPGGLARPNYKWLGGAVGSDGCIYCPACDTSAVLKIDPRTGECTTFGDAGSDKNKWQGGVLSPRDSCIYCIPASGRHVLRISTSTNPPALQLLGDLPAHKDKWQGGHVGRDGNLYFIPENGYRVLRVTPAARPPELVDGKLPLDEEVKLEYL